MAKERTVTNMYASARIRGSTPSSGRSLEKLKIFPEEIALRERSRAATAPGSKQSSSHAVW